MMENDDILVSKFFEEYTQEVEDHGFTKRVIRHLPDRAARLNRIWTALCIVAGIVFFIGIKGWKIIAESLLVLFHTTPALDVFQLSPLTIILSVLALTTVGVYQLASRELRL